MNFKTDCLKNKVIMVTGGTGSFGKQFVETVLRDQTPKKADYLQPRRVEAIRHARAFQRTAFPCMRYFSATCATASACIAPWTASIS